MREDDEKTAKPARHEIGQDLSALSMVEIDARVALLGAEIERLKAAYEKKKSSQAAAASFFKT